MPAEVVGALIAIGGVLLGSVVTAVVTVWVENTRQKAESTRQEQALAAERQRTESAFAHDSRMRQLDWRRAERKVVIDHARAFLDAVSLLSQEIDLLKRSEALTGKPTSDKVSLELTTMHDVLKQYATVWLSVPDPDLGDLLRSLAVETLHPDWTLSPEHQDRVRQAYRRLEEVAALLDEPQPPSRGS